ncbi:ATP synthase F0 subunit B [Nonomuraea sp. NPDC048882]|uniref:ATP synthase F0 subunit B n=1 Tax=Nonomuraea sp. NPDC048882 TaxID=3154347 RepID=UPI0033DE065C
MNHDHTPDTPQQPLPPIPHDPVADYLDFIDKISQDVDHIPDQQIDERARQLFGGPSLPEEIWASGVTREISIVAGESPHTDLDCLRTLRSDDIQKGAPPMWADTSEIVNAAHREAHRIQHRARMEAQADAARFRAAAERDASERLDTALTQAAGIVTDARRTAETQAACIRAEAERDAADLINAAHRQAARIRAEAERDAADLINIAHRVVTHITAETRPPTRSEPGEIHYYPARRQSRWRDVVLQTGAALREKQENAERCQAYIHYGHHGINVIFPQGVEIVIDLLSLALLSAHCAPEAADVAAQRHDQFEARYERCRSWLAESLIVPKLPHEDCINQAVDPPRQTTTHGQSGLPVMSSQEPAHVTFATNTTVVVGSNNCGKSSILTGSRAPVTRLLWEPVKLRLAEEFPTVPVDTIDLCVADVSACAHRLGIFATPELVECLAREQLFASVVSAPPPHGVIIATVDDPRPDHASERGDKLPSFK